MIQYLSGKTGIHASHLASALKLLDEGGTIPFIARYRKESTGSLDEVALEMVKLEAQKYRELLARQTFISETIKSQGKLTPQLAQRISTCFDPLELEDLYLPYKTKRKTRADKAREQGLEPLALRLLDQSYEPLDRLVKTFVTKQITSEQALTGARDIIAELVSEDPQSRQFLRGLFTKHALVNARVIKGHEELAQKFRDYYHYQEKITTMPSHRIMAVFRGEQEGHLSVDIETDSERTIAQLQTKWVRNRSASAAQVAEAVMDGYKRLLQPSLSTEFHHLLKEKADAEAISVFAQNVHDLLLAAPLGEKPVLAIDPGFRTGCKIVALDEMGTLLDHTTIYPHPPQQDSSAALKTVTSWIQKFHLQAIAIGNGTAGRETFDWLIAALPHWSASMYLISESGASIYSASPVAREEFPDLDLTVRGAISIGRRLQDPLAELIKIDPKSIGVGQYQHDVHQKALRDKLDRVVESCVNQVGVHLNTASKQLLAQVSGIGPVVAENIIRYRQENGPFSQRHQLLNVPKLGPKAFEQCAGFLRIRDGGNPLDQTAVHPERYALVRRMTTDLGCDLSQLVADKSLLKKIDLKSYISEQVGLPTLQDILKELEKPGLDPRGKAEVPSYTVGIRSMDDLQPGMFLTGTVTNLTQFGAFVDIGVKQDGMVHISELASHFVRRPEEVLTLNQKVQVKVLSVDHARKRINLSIKQAQA